MYDLDFTTLYSQPSERYERVLRHKKKRNKKNIFFKKQQQSKKFLFSELY